MKPKLHLEISTKCVLACPACPRTIFIDKIKPRDLSLGALENSLSGAPEFREILFCGDHGDPIYHSQFHEVLARVQRAPGNPPIFINTNGSHRSQEWWEKTATLLQKKDSVVFGIDGMEDTAKVYRRRIDWNSAVGAMRTLKANSECSVQWQWILFASNQHQMSDAARLAKDIGVDRFLIVESSRFVGDDPFRPTISLETARSQFKEAYI